LDIKKSFYLCSPKRIASELSEAGDEKKFEKVCEGNKKVLTFAPPKAGNRKKGEKGTEFIEEIE